MLPNILHRMLNQFTIFFTIKLKPETFALLNNCCSERLTFLPYSTRENYCVNLALQLHVVAANKTENAIYEDVEGQLAFGSVRAGDFPEISGSC